MSAIYEVRECSRSDAKELIIGIHYAHRWPSISHLFGLYLGCDLRGVCSFGTPASAPLRSGLAGQELSSNVIELNRLVLSENEPNEASRLVSSSIRLLPKNKIIVSFADISTGHIGTVYQASNFIYCGLSAKRTDWKIRGKEHLHGQTIADEFRGVSNRADAMREKYGDDFYLAPRPRKHRYIYIHGSVGFRKFVEPRIRYASMPYPKRTDALQEGDAA